MPNIKVLKNPGYLYDLNYLFYLKFNKELCIESVEKSRRDEAKAYFTHISTLFGDISDDLFVFYHADESGRCFMITYFFDPYKNQFATNFDFTFLKNKLTDVDNLIKGLIRFYFTDFPQERLAECLESREKLFSAIKESSYDNEKKCRLYEFFHSPLPYIQMLQSELIEKEILLTSYYQEHYNLILTAHNNTSIEVLSQSIKGEKDFTFIKDEGKTLFTSYCLLHKYWMKYFFIPEGVIYFLGYDYAAGMHAYLEQIKTPPLENLCAALGEKSRIQILDHLLKMGEATCKDLEKIFDFSGSTAYHHITILSKIGAVKVRNEGKTIFYSVNKPFFDTVRNLLAKYSKN